MESMTSPTKCHQPPVNTFIRSHTLRDAGPERGLDPAVPVPALGRGKRLRRLRPEPGVFVNGEPGVVVVVARGSARKVAHFGSWPSMER